MHAGASNEPIPFLVTADDKAVSYPSGILTP
jgi:hypothetical protein